MYLLSAIESFGGFRDFYVIEDMAPGFLMIFLIHAYLAWWISVDGRCPGSSWPVMAWTLLTGPVALVSYLLVTRGRQGCRPAVAVLYFGCLSFIGGAFIGAHLAGDASRNNFLEALGERIR